MPPSESKILHFPCYQSSTYFLPSADFQHLGLSQPGFLTLASCLPVEPAPLGRCPVLMLASGITWSSSTIAAVASAPLSVNLGKMYLQATPLEKDALKALFVWKLFFYMNLQFYVLKASLHEVLKAAFLMSVQNARFLLNCTTIFGIIDSGSKLAWYSIDSLLHPFLLPHCIIVTHSCCVSSLNSY